MAYISKYQCSYCYFTLFCFLDFIQRCFMCHVFNSREICLDSDFNQYLLYLPMFSSYSLVWSPISTYKIGLMMIHTLSFRIFVLLALSQSSHKLSLFFIIFFSFLFLWEFPNILFLSSSILMFDKFFISFIVIFSSRSDF